MRPLILFEPENLSPFGPLTLLRSVAELRYGIYSNLERAERIFTEDRIQLWIRPILAKDHRNRFRNTPINENADNNAIFCNAVAPAWMYPAAIALLENEQNAAIVKDGSIIAAKPSVAINFSPRFHNELANLKTIECDQTICKENTNWIWDYLNLITPAVNFDLELWKANNNLLTKIPADLSTIGEKHIFIHSTAQLSKFVHMDASQGPIIIDKDCKIGPFCSLEGPLYLGKRSTLKPSTSIRYSVIGQVCNFGGEVKGSIIHPYSNKSHAGFLGESILGSWVNLGAGTITSNLKNNYQPIRVSWDGNNYETNRQFLGTIMGDHCKTAIGVRLNTGTLIGPFSNVFQADFPPRAIPSFSWGYGTHELEKAIKTSQQVMARRNLTMSSSEEDLIRLLTDDNTPFIHF